MCVFRKLESPPLSDRPADERNGGLTTEPSSGCEKNTITACSDGNGTAGGYRKSSTKNGMVGGMSILRAVEGNAAAMSSLFPG